MSLFTFSPHVDQRTLQADTLLITVGSYTDAGRVQRLIDDALLNNLANYELGSFDSDRLYDYTGHRPVITFDQDHFRDYERPELKLHHLTDVGGKPFLLLSGPEPNFQWENIASSVDYLIDQFGVQKSVIVHGFPAPTPHTRPTFVSQFAQQADLRDDSKRLPMSFQMSSAFGGMLAYRLGEADRNVMGLIAHVPQYLAHTEHPAAAIALLDGVMGSTGLALPTASLEGRVGQTLAELDAQVADDEETAAIVGQLERQYDAFMSQRELTASTEIPSGEEIAAEFEEFLAGLNKPDDDLP